jgi:hypothetical protein
MLFTLRFDFTRICRLMINQTSFSAPALRSLCILIAAPVASISTAYADTKPADGVAAVVTPLSLVKRADLDMGIIIPGNSPSTVTLETDGTRSSTGTVTLTGTDHNVARFAGLGSQNQRVEIDLPTSINLTGPGPSMVMDNFDFGPDATLPGTYARVGSTNGIDLLDPTGAFGFVVGATLQVGGNQPGGTYTGSFDVTADYQ